MKTRFLYFICTFLISLGCSSEDEDAMQDSKAPAWVAEYPIVASGATTADLNVRTDRSSTVYFVISDKPLNLTAAQVRQNALSPASSAIKASGSIQAKAAIEARKTIIQLTQRTGYYSYFVAQNISDTVVQDAVMSRQFSTGVRQDTSEFVSAVENRKVKFLIYRPEEVLKYPGKQYPICYFLAGNGELATTDKPINLIRNGSLPEYIYKGNDVPMMVLSIQHTQKNWSVSLIDEAIVHGNKTFPADPKRVYLSGMSGGGFGCWNYAETFPEKLAAIVPISGGGNTTQACNLKNVPVWAFHNQSDNIISSSNTTNMVKSLNNCPPNKEVKQLIFPDTGHDCWRRVYDQNHPNWSKSPEVEKFDIYSWLLTNSK